MGRTYPALPALFRRSSSPARGREKEETWSGRQEQSQCLQATPIFDGEEIEAVTVLDVDLVHLHSLETELTRSNAFLRNLIMSSVDGIIASDMKGRILIFNEAASQISRYSIDEALTSLNIRDFYPGEGAREIMRKLRSEEYGGKGKLNSCEVDYRRKDGAIFQIRLSAAMVFFTGKSRLLIADEVGLGKTIEAGLVWTELEARRLADRVLVVCPSGLVSKWKLEMENRFGFHLQELTSNSLGELTTKLENDRLPRRGAYICSLERLRLWEDLDTATDLGLRFSLVIVDEAHAFRNLGTRSNVLGSVLSQWADALLFLSATPLNLGNADLYNLLELLAPGEFGNLEVLEQRLQPNAVLHRISDSLLDRDVSNPRRLAWLHEIPELTFGQSLSRYPEYTMLEAIMCRATLTPADIAQSKRLIASLHALSAVVTRTRKAEVQEDKAIREPRIVSVQWDPTEQAFYEAFYEWCKLRADSVDMPVGFSMQMPLRLVSSCLPAARDQVLNWRSGQVPLDEDAPSSDRTTTIDLVPPTMQLLDRAQEVGNRDSKLDRFRPVLGELVAQQRRVLVFTFSRATLAYLESQLCAEFRVAVLHGGVKSDERNRVMADFRSGVYDVLLANRVASEGLDFEFCSAVVNYDLPWNPMEVEQRIGRIDRIGQLEEKIHVINFQTPGTIESDIIERVMTRIGVFERSIGELEPILASRIGELRETVFDFALSPEQRIAKADQILAAIESQKLERVDVESASAYLISSDGVDIEGLEGDLISRGRYMGQPELALLISDWAATAGGTIKTTPDGRCLTVLGNNTMAEQLRKLQVGGERSQAEVDEYVDALLDEHLIYLSLDQEWSREGGPTLLTSNHPLVRAALGAPSHRQARFAEVCIANPGAAPAGDYLVYLATAEWQGIRPSSEIWAAGVDLATLEPGSAEIGDALLAGLASASLTAGAAVSEPDSLPNALDVARRVMLQRQSVEEQRRQDENDALLATRRLSIAETSERKRQQILARLETLRTRGDRGMDRLFEAQLRHEDRRRRNLEADVADGARSGMQLSPLAVCIVEVRHP